MTDVTRPDPDPDTGPTRVRFTAWFDPELLVATGKLAETETEGNVAMMLRRLLREALAARKVPKARP